MVIIHKSNIHGKGVFTKEDIDAGTFLTCDVIEVISHKLINQYIFPTLNNKKYIHLGFASFFNRSASPNVKHIKIDTNELISYFEVIKEIKNGEELFLCY